MALPLPEEKARQLYNYYYTLLIKGTGVPLKTLLDTSQIANESDLLEIESQIYDVVIPIAVQLVQHYCDEMISFIDNQQLLLDWDLKGYYESVKADISSHYYFNK